MPTFQHPGIYVSEQLIGPTPAPPSTNPSLAAFVGEWWRGPAQAILCRSWGDFVNYFGGFMKPSQTVPVLTNPYLGYAVYEFFSNGGQRCWVQRVTASLQAGASATCTLLDRQATPVGTLLLTTGALGTSGSVGTWGNSLYATVTARLVGGVDVGRFDLTLYYGGTLPTNQVESWIDLSMSKTDNRYAPTVLNSTVQGSMFVVATDLSDAAASPNNAPAVVAGKQFTAGADTGSPSTADKTAAVTFGTSNLDAVAGTLNINMPGETNTTVTTALLNYSTARPYTFVVIDSSSGLTPAAAVSYEQSLTPAVSNGALYYPWVTATDPSQTNLQTTKLLPPGGFVLGQFAKMDVQTGVWRAPAGTQTVLANVVSGERTFSTSDIDLLNTNSVNTIRALPNGQVVIWGTRTLQTGFATLYVPVRRTLNYIEAALDQLLSFAVFAPNDALLWANIVSVVTNFLQGMFTMNAFPGTDPTQAYYVTCDASNNTQTSIAQGVVNTTVGVALTTPAEFINLIIAQFQTNGATNITTTTTVATA